MLEPHPTCRLQRIDIKSGNAIDDNKVVSVQLVTCRSAAGAGACALRSVGARGGNGTLTGLFSRGRVTFDDETVWSNGRDGGKADGNPVGARAASLCGSGRGVRR